MRANLTATLHCGQILEIPDLATLLKSQAAQAGITLNVAVESLDTFYGAQWCPATPADPPCSGAAELGIVDYGHRATPDVYLNSALEHQGRLERVAVLVPRVRRRIQGVPERRRRRCPEGGRRQDRDHPASKTRPSACRTSTTTSPAIRRSSPASIRAASDRCSSRPRPRSDTRGAWGDGGDHGPHVAVPPDRMS